MKNITVSVDDGTYRRARIKAAGRDISASALVRDILAREESGFERLKREKKELRASIEGFSAADRLPCEELYGRGRR